MTQFQNYHKKEILVKQEKNKLHLNKGDFNRIASWDVSIIIVSMLLEENWCHIGNIINLAYCHWLLGDFNFTNLEL